MADLPRSKWEEDVIYVKALMELAKVLDEAHAHDVATERADVLLNEDYLCQGTGQSTSVASTTVDDLTKDVSAMETDSSENVN